jgi:hypothetical protein
MSNTCEFCSSTFSNKKSLIYHQKNAKYCLQARGSSTSFRCRVCSKELSEKRQLEKHEEKCGLAQKTESQGETILKLTQELEVAKQMSSLFQTQLAQKDEQIKELQNKLENIAIQGVKKSTSTSITNNQIINNLIPITDDHLKEQSRFLTLDHIKQGAVGYANFACEHALKDRVACTDLSRRKIKYKNPEGQLVSDPEMMVISKKLFCAISEKNKQLSDQYRGELINMMLDKYRECGDDMKDEETRELEKYIAEINKDMDHLLTVYGQARDIAEGQRPEMYHEFVREVCNKTVS